MSLSFDNFPFIIIHLACIGVDIGASIVEYVIAQVGCSGKTITDFTTTSPVGLTKSAIQNPSTGD